MKKVMLAISLLVVSTIGVASAHGGRNFDHPEMLGFKEDHRIMQKLSAYDLDKDGMLSKTELDNYKKKAGLSLSKIEQSDHSFMKVDLNHDAFLSFDEFLKLPENEITVDVFGPEFMKVPPRAPFGPFGEGPFNHMLDNDHAKKHNRPMPDVSGSKADRDNSDFKKEMRMNRLFKRFNRHDTDFNGKLDYEEYKTLLENSGKHQKDKQLWVEKADFRTMDINQDGFISILELKHFMHGLSLLKTK